MHLLFPAFSISLCYRRSAPLAPIKLSTLSEVGTISHSFLQLGSSSCPSLFPTLCPFWGKHRTLGVLWGWTVHELQGLSEALGGGGGGVGEGSAC